MLEMEMKYVGQGHTEAQCKTWCATCWGNMDCHNCTGSSFANGICTITVFDSGDWWKIKNSNSNYQYFPCCVASLQRLCSSVHACLYSLVRWNSRSESLLRAAGALCSSDVVADAIRAGWGGWGESGATNRHRAPSQSSRCFITSLSWKIIVVVFGNKLMRTLNTPRWLLQASSAYAAGERLRILTTASTKIQMHRQLLHMATASQNQKSACNVQGVFSDSCCWLSGWGGLVAVSGCRTKAGAPGICGVATGPMIASDDPMRQRWKPAVFRLLIQLIGWLAS